MGVGMSDYRFDRLKVLVVDDNVHMRKLVTTILQAFGVSQILEAENGEKLLRAQERLVETERDLRKFMILAINDAAAATFDRLKQDKKLKRIGRADLLIAAITMSNRATLVTRNLRDFRQISGLQVENWAD